MKAINKKYIFGVLILIVFFSFGFKRYEPCGLFTKVYKIKINDVSKVNNNYFLCYLEEEPIICEMDSSLENSFPWYLHGSSKYLENPNYLRQVKDIGVPEHLKGEIISYTIIKLKVKPIEIYFTKYSYKDFRGLNMDIREGKMPKKEPFLDFNTLYYITCKLSEINLLKKAYNQKSLVLLDRILPEKEVDYYYSLNSYSAEKIDFNKLYSFNSIVMELKEEQEKRKENINK